MRRNDGQTSLSLKLRFSLQQNLDLKTIEFQLDKNEIASLCQS